ncbi:BZ3500_MvSof-1268-A1-R1_Chr1-1g01100 [Microbotryum saponariae]|uniref:BZ3500_MvSof-1268-A1-R1_Chr1-1g01100 protein n=1 Tax=Microbotryum saponariae TaxID=289078 RepID=A0A2X0MNG1_9BASI|nr:BZ3500_MvSof-1268-A1-R1_Chr1-1g01100 [Microbotryum saponariae]SCZ93385.1 BZ3501_MvSof-1269-A2-R1_Chr1-1g00697 [Microbotryum saponariae]
MSEATSPEAMPSPAPMTTGKPEKVYETVSDPQKLWPVPGTRWDSPKDLLLVMQLATLAAGYSATANLASRVTPTATAHAFIRCIEAKTPNSGGCQSTLAVLQYANAKNPHGTCRVQLPPKAGKSAKPSLKDHHSHPDSGHLKVGDVIQPTEPPMSLEVGPTVYTLADINKLEAYARADSRRDPHNAVITVVRSKDILFKCRGKNDNDDACLWQIRLTPTSAGAKTYTCKEIEPDHTCEPAHPAPSAHLNTVLDYFPSLHLKQGLIGKSKLQQSRKIQKQQQAKAPRKRAPIEPSDDEDEDEEGVLSDSGLQQLCDKLIVFCPPVPIKSLGAQPAKRLRSSASPASLSDLSDGDAHSTGGAASA